MPLVINHYYPTMVSIEINLLRSPFSRPAVAPQAAHADTLPSVLHFKHIILRRNYWSCISSILYYAFDGTTFPADFKHIYWSYVILSHHCPINSSYRRWPFRWFYIQWPEISSARCQLSEESKVFPRIKIASKIPRLHCIIKSSYLWPLGWYAHVCYHG